MMHHLCMEENVSDQPKRIQRKRTKGWKMPEGAVYVGRPTKWGNPYKVTPDCTAEEAVSLYRQTIERGPRNLCEFPDCFDIRAELRGKDLACWCPLDQACHADVLLEIANL